MKGSLPLGSIHHPSSGGRGHSLHPLIGTAFVPPRGLSDGDCGGPDCRRAESCDRTIQGTGSHAPQPQTSSPACAPLSRTPACRSPTAPTDSCVKPLTRRVLPSAGVAVSRDWINPRRSNSREGACAGAESFTSISCYKLPKLGSSHRPAKPRRFGVQPKGCVPGRRGFRSSIRPATRSLGGGRAAPCPAVDPDLRFGSRPPLQGPLLA
jgi:hypothetical protein